ncbi:hypothetical protein LY78DRAFT_80472 [Colletotrichum sublineola]|nr:hypothetical protein LY78DRAFT_80472 [Colletotrichum sublineola]
MTGTNNKVIKQERGEGLSFVKARLSRRVLQANCLETRGKGPSSPTAFYVRLPVLIHVSITGILWSVLQRVFAQLYLEIAVRIKNLCVWTILSFLSFPLACTLCPVRRPVVRHLTPLYLGSPLKARQD